MLALGLKPKRKTWERERRELVIVACTGFVILFSLAAIVFLVPPDSIIAGMMFVFI